MQAAAEQAGDIVSAWHTTLAEGVSAARTCSRIATDPGYQFGAMPLLEQGCKCMVYPAGGSMCLGRASTC